MLWRDDTSCVATRAGRLYITGGLFLLIPAFIDRIFHVRGENTTVKP